MKSASPWLPKVFAGLALVLAATSSAFADTWFESYHKAENALREERWSEAVRLLNAALDERPESGVGVRTYGMRFVDYFPYLDLGIAYFHLGQLDAALSAFETEERQGAIHKSRPARERLAEYSNRIERERQQASAERENRARALLADYLANAQRLEGEGRAEEALEEAGKALAVSPGDPDATQIHQRLQATVAEQLRQARDRQRRIELVASARSALAAAQYREASALLSEALELGEDATVRALLQQAQRALRADLEQRSESQSRQALIRLSLTRARELEASGQLAQALAEIQAVLALEPGNSSAQALATRLARAQLGVDEERDRVNEIAELLSRADAALERGDSEDALRASNRALALDPDNGAALRQVSRAYAHLSDSWLTTDDEAPTILLEGDRPMRDGVVTEVTRQAENLLTGTIYDASPVVVEALSAQGPMDGLSTQSRELQGLWVTSFRLNRRLSAGLSGVEIVATDQGGNRSSLRHEVQYQRPFHLSAWFPASLASGLAVSGIGLVILRRRRRHRALRERFNPYIAGAPILQQERFFGRQDLLHYVLRRIGNNSVMLYGERRIGKTSFQHRLRRCLSRLDDPVHEFHPVFVDLQGTPQERFFATLAAEIFHELAPRIEGVDPPSTLGHDSYGYRDLVRDIHGVLRVLKGRTDKKVKLVLQIDEVDELNEYDPRINQRLRSLFMRAFADNLVSVVSGVSIKKQWEREGSPWYNFFQEVEVKPLDAAEARELIEAPVKGIFSFESGISDEIVRRTRAKPYLIQRLCSVLVDFMHEEGRQRITAEDLEAACRVEGLS